MCMHVYPYSWSQNTGVRVLQCGFYTVIAQVLLVAVVYTIPLCVEPPGVHPSLKQMSGGNPEG